VLKISQKNNVADIKKEIVENYKIIRTESIKTLLETKDIVKSSLLDIRGEVKGTIKEIKTHVISSNDTLYEQIDLYIKQAINKIIPYLLIAIIAITTTFIIMLIIYNPPKVPKLTSGKPDTSVISKTDTSVISKIEIPVISKTDSLINLNSATVK